MNKAVLSLLVSNHFGVLTRITSLFSQRGFNIDTVAAGVTENPQYSRITVTTSSEPKTVNQIKLQLAKLEDVKVVQEIPDEQLFIREVSLIKVQPAPEQVENFEKAVRDFGGRTQIVQDGCYIVQITDTPATIDYFIEELREYHIKELSRTGGAALQLSTETVY